MKFSPTRTDLKIAILSPDIPDIEWTRPVPGPSATNLWEFHSIHNSALHKKLQFANSKPSMYRPVNQLITLMGEMNQNIIHSTNNIGSTLLNNNTASDVSEWFLEWFWSCELLCLRLLFIVPISFIRWCILFHYNQNLAPDQKKKKPTRTERKLPHSRPDPISWPRNGPIPSLSKI